jgi:hypothetical protein
MLLNEHVAVKQATAQQHETRKQLDHTAPVQSTASHAAQRTVWMKYETSKTVDLSTEAHCKHPICKQSLDA